MAIQINGDGTITGINVGGLPDGIVDTDMSAANSVAVKVAAKLATGKVLQVSVTVKTDVVKSVNQHISWTCCSNFFQNDSGSVFINRQ